MAEQASKQPSIRRRVIYRGRVQGVGFRFTTVSIAKRYPVEGFVKNLSDGTVEIVVEGVSGHVDDFLQEVADSFRSNLRDVTLERAEPTGEFAVFEVRH